MSTIQIPQEISAMAAMLAEEVNAQKQQKEQKQQKKKPEKKKTTKEKDQEEKTTKEKKNEKAPLSAFMLFNQAIRKKIKEEFPDKDFKEIGKEVGARWKALDTESRAPYETKSKQMKEEWIKTHPESTQKKKQTRKRKRTDADEKEDDGTKKSKNASKKKKNKKTKNEKTDDDNDDKNDQDDDEKKPAYIRHADMVRPAIQNEFPTMSPRSIASEVANRWRRLTTEEKEKLRA